MGSSKATLQDPSPLSNDFLTGGGELGALMRAMDWPTTKLGSLYDWPQSLRTSVSVCLNSRFPIIIWWGRDLTVLYNDAYAPFLGVKHPSALGRPGSEVWHEIWDVVGPMLEGVMQRGEATWSDDLLLLLERHGYPEECYFTFSYSPIRDESGGIGGVFTPVKETTEKVIGERRLRTLRDLAARGADAESEPEAWTSAAQVLSENAQDVPFAVLYRLNDAHKSAEAMAYAGIPAENGFCPGTISLEDGGPVANLLQEAGTRGRLTELNLADEPLLPGGAWGVPPNQLLAAPLSQAAQMDPLGVLVAGVSRRKALDEDYRTFFNLVAGQIAKQVADARAYEHERKRAEALAEIDRAKTIFFSNASHEFRTPLTLMLGPLEELLRRGDNPTSVTRDELELIHRNGIRLLKLVNTLLDFSRIEAGRVQAVYEPVDLAAITADIASAFRTTIERAGLEFIVDCQPCEESAYVDRDMWEKIVLNLISNAFKFTFEGRIAVQLATANGRFELSVSDTGTGIPDYELPRIFERFHRVEGTRGRTHEGTGIGLALVHELVKLHGGSIRVESAIGKGSAFIVSISQGRAHLPAEHVGATAVLSSTAASAAAYVEEASRWLPDSGSAYEGMPVLAADSVQAPHVQTVTGRILLADDNADMRDYVRRLLGGRYQVEAVSNGRLALAAARENPPDLILTDAMMPELDGFGLLKELRAAEATQTIPVILLSARAGEDARVEGLEAGADDYIVKPFTSRELLARVGAHLALSRLHREATERERELRAEAETARERVVSTLESMNDGYFALDSCWRITYANAAAERINEMGRGEIIGKEIWHLFPAIAGTRLEVYFRRAMESRIPVQLENFYEPWQRWFDVRILPASDGGLSIFYQDITDRKRAEEGIRKANEALRRANADLEQFAYSATHDLQEPLRTLRAFCQLLERKYTGQLDSEAHEIIDYCVQGAERMQVLIDNLLAYIRASDESETLPEPTDLESALGAALLNLRAAIEQSGAIVTHDPLPTLRIGATHFEQILQNLISNAIKYRGQEPPKVHVRAVENEQAWVFSVEDNGVGIEPEYHERVFGLFKRLGVDRTGSGIGLAICKKLVERYGGSIWVRSEPGKGSIFSFTVPKGR